MLASAIVLTFLDQSSNIAVNMPQGKNANYVVIKVVLQQPYHYSFRIQEIASCFVDFQECVYKLVAMSNIKAVQCGTMLEHVLMNRKILP